MTKTIENFSMEKQKQIYKVLIINYLNNSLFLFFSILFFNSNLLKANNLQIRTAQTEINRIYSQLKSAIGDTRPNLPKLEVLDRKKNGAAYRRADNKLIFEVQLFEVCQSLGENSEVAIAFILGHELAHFYHHHEWGETGFGMGFLPDKAKFSERIAEEKDADVYGGFVTYLAGYDFECIVPDLFEKIYDAYGWRENIQNYPPLEDRKRVIAEVRPKVRELIDIYETAKYLSLTGRFELAEISYQYLLNFIKTKEIYNNLATAQLTPATQMTEYDERRFAFPLDLDIYNPLQRVGADVRRIDLLNEAKKNLQNALEYDVNYFSAQLNLGCVFVLMKNFSAAKNHLKKAENLAKSAENRAKVQIAYGILNHFEGNSERGNVHFKTAKSLTRKSDIRIIADYNLTGKTPKLKRLSGHSLRGQLEGLDLTNRNVISKIQFDNSVEVRPKGRLVEGNYKIKIKRFRNSILFQYYFPQYADIQSLTIHRTVKKGVSTSDNFSVGTPVSTLEKTFKKDSPFILSHQKGHLRFYESKGLIFHIGNDEKIREWGVFVVY